MNTLLKGTFIVALILLLGGCSEQIYAQRCGGNLTLIMRNENGKITDPGKLGLKYIRVKKRIDSTELVTDYAIKDSVQDVDTIKVIYLDTSCWEYLLVEIAFEIEDRTMLLRFHNFPMELNVFVDSLPFQEGTFEIDFKWDLALKGQELNRKGLKDKDGKRVLREKARAGYLVSANNWIRTNSQPKAHLKTH